MNKGEKLEPYLMMILASKFEAIAAEMGNTLIRSARSAVINIGGDIACAIVTSDGRSISQQVGCPSLCAALGDAAKPIAELYDDVAPGDCFLNNSPYHGNTHHGDYTFIVPVFYEGRHLFNALTRGHQADIGNSLPTTMTPLAKDIYEEGAINFPCVRVQRDYREVSDIVRMGLMRIRIPDQWYGDFLAGVGAARIGERRLIELCDKYGVELIMQFVEEWFDYSAAFMKNEIKKLPKVSLEGEIRHDPIEGVAPEGVPIRAKIDIEPDQGFITVDVTDNLDSLPCGYNLCQSNTKAAIYSGIINNLDSSLPHNDGTASRILMIMREGAIVGKVRHPDCCSVSTTDFAGRLTNLIQTLIAKLGVGKGLAEGASCAAPGTGTKIVGRDFRHDNRPFVTGIFIGFGGGPALKGHDGWLTYMIPAVGGVEPWNSVEIIENNCPVIVEKDEIHPDSGGAGQWDGAPGFNCIMRPRVNPASFSYLLDSNVYPAGGLFGGQAGGPAMAWKVNQAGEKVELPPASTQVIQPDEKIVGVWAGGGGYGDPLERDPQKVCWRVQNGWVTVQKARDVYGVVLDASSAEYEVDLPATKVLRTAKQKERAT